MTEDGLCFSMQIQCSWPMWDSPTWRSLITFISCQVCAKPNSLIFTLSHHTTYLWWIPLLQGSVNEDSFPLSDRFQFCTSCLTILGNNQPHNFPHLPITAFHIVLVHQYHFASPTLLRSSCSLRWCSLKSVRYFFLHRFQKWNLNLGRYLNLLKNRVSLSSSSFLTSLGTTGVGTGPVLWRVLDSS